jgi:hypothetical protein
VHFWYIPAERAFTSKRLLDVGDNLLTVLALLSFELCKLATLKVTFYTCVVTIAPTTYDFYSRLTSAFQNTRSKLTSSACLKTTHLTSRRLTLVPTKKRLSTWPKLDQ